MIGDLQRPSQLEVCVDWRSGSGTLVVSEGLGGASSKVFEPGDERGELLRCWLADHLQQYFFWESDGAWGEARPECPGHSHPAKPELIDDEAWWVCPLDDRPITRFGAGG